jgi:tRNA1Val (adenine37-N6)-methyltransferase
MKVCTDACLFGAWVARSVVSSEWPVGSILDIGSGTGLLSLMLAQQTVAQIDAIEMDEAAAEQAGDNFENSVWKDRLQVITGDAKLMHLGKKYELIISNPPFFENDLKSEDAKKNLALHSEQLSLQDLLLIIKSHLALNGKFAVLLPYHRKNAFVQSATNEGFFLEEVVSVKQTPKHTYFRSMLLFSAVEVPLVDKEIIIREGEVYSNKFNNLLKDYYLKL